MTARRRRPAATRRDALAATPRAVPARRRRGFSLTELLTATVLSGILLSGLVALMERSAALLGNMVARSEAAEALRTTWVILDLELGAGAPGADWELEGETAIRLRAFRGVARVCDPDGAGGADGTYEVAWRGWRAPDVARDSVLVLDAAGVWRAAALSGVGAAGTGCADEGGEVGATLRWEGSGAGRPFLVRWFERGRYSLEDGAFRYRRGGEGRQPLTSERIGDGSGFAMDPEGLRVRVVLEPGGVVAWRISFVEVRTGNVP